MARQQSIEHVGDKLFQDGKWELWGYPKSHEVIIWHRCDGEWSYVYNHGPGCAKCKVKPPTALVGLRNLHVWER